MSAKWNSLQKLLFLFMGIYFFFYTDILGWVFGFSVETILWNKIIPPFAKFAGATKEVVIRQTSSGDTSFDYYLFFFLLLVSLFSALIIFIIDRKRENYNQLLKWLMILMRYYLFVVMLGYGLSKIYVLQFPSPHDITLESTYGESYPMTLLWTFMGYSRPYQIFAGLLELLGGVFLLSRKTIKLGALICFGVMLNVMMMNYCYDVCVKLFSTHLVFISLLLVLFYSKDFFSFFIRNEIVNPIEIVDVVSQKWQEVKFCTKWILLVGFIAFNVYKKNDLNNRVHSPINKLRTSYVAEQFYYYTKDEKQSAAKDSLIWKALKVTRHEASVEYRDIIQWYKCKINEDEKTFTFKESFDAIEQTLNYKTDGKNTLILTGFFNNDSIYVKLKNKGPKHHLLKGKFRWLQEQPREPY